MAGLNPFVLVLGVAAIFALPFALFGMVRQFTGRHMLIFALGMFGMIIAVNIVLAVKAVGTFPGLEVKNSYVASQSFDRDRTAQSALGWQVTPEYADGIFSLTIRDDQGRSVRPETLQVVVGRPTHVREDQSLVLIYENGVYWAPVDLAPGLWNVNVTATAGDGTAFRQRIDHFAGARVGQ